MHHAVMKTKTQVVQSSSMPTCTVCMQAHQAKMHSSEGDSMAYTNMRQPKRAQDDYATPEVPWQKARKPSTAPAGQITDHGTSTAKPKRHTGPRYSHNRSRPCTRCLRLVRFVMFIYTCGLTFPLFTPVSKKSDPNMVSFAVAWSCLLQTQFNPLHGPYACTYCPDPNYTM